MEFSSTPYGSQPPIEAYGDGGFRLDKKRVSGSMILLPDEGMFPWHVVSAEALCLADLQRFVDIAEQLDLVLVGTGERLLFLPRELKQALADIPLHVEVMDTGAACRTYNVLLGEGRRVAAALVAVV
ncbi:MAG: Mth938-like domain-containing protein [Parvibaculum sp.]